MRGIVVVAYQHMAAGDTTVFISKDINARIKSDSLGIETEDFEAQKVDADRLYSGYTEIQCDADLINRLYDEKQLPVTDLEPYLNSDDDDPAPDIVSPAEEEVDVDDAVVGRLGFECFVPVGVPEVDLDRPARPVPRHALRRNGKLDRIRSAGRHAGSPGNQ